MYNHFREALQTAGGRAARPRWDTFVVLVADRFEGLYVAVGDSFFGQLRNLRDEARGGADGRSVTLWTG